MLIIFKAFNNHLPVYVENVFKVRTNIKNLMGMNKLVLPHGNTGYGLNQWSIQQLRPGTVTSLKSFKVAVRIGSCFPSIIFLVLSQLVFYSFS